ncbi:MAG: pyrrolysine--tRNA(Pyl) ligase large subunit [Desulforhopalus sp.]
MADNNWTQTQIRRFKELGIEPEDIQIDVSTPKERNIQFQEIEKKHVRIEKEKLLHLLSQTQKTQLQLLKEKLEQTLLHHGFTGVSTPTIISGQALKKMSIDQDHPLSKQVFWLSEKQCLRPMLAPNLYSLMQDFSRLRQKPIRFFEIGSCFRKESQGARHSNEFTMLNLVEMGIPEHYRQERLEFLADTIMKVAGVTDYFFESEDSEVYGSTLDVLACSGELEVASGAMGPHRLDAAWGVTDTWVGLGFGVERLLMASRSDNSIGKWSKSLSYIDGICLNI